MNNYTVSNECASLNGMGQQQQQSCCFGPCKMNVEKGCFLIVRLCFAVSAVSAVRAFWPESSAFHAQNVWEGFGHLLFAIFYVLIMVAQWKDEHRLFWPFLIIQGVHLPLKMIMFLVTLVHIWADPRTVIEEFNQLFAPEPGTSGDISESRLLFTLGAYTIGFALNVWFYTIFFRAYKAQRNRTLEALKVMEEVEFFSIS